MCYKFIQILVRSMIFGTSDKFTSFLIFKDWQGATEFDVIFGGSALQADLVIEVPSHWELQHSSSETWCNSVQGYITILMGALTKPHWNLLHRLSSLPWNHLLCGERIPHALLSKLISSPSSTFYSIFFSQGIKMGDSSSNSVENKDKILD